LILICYGFLSQWTEGNVGLRLKIPSRLVLFRPPAGRNFTITLLENVCWNQHCQKTHPLISVIPGAPAPFFFKPKNLQFNEEKIRNDQQNLKQVCSHRWCFQSLDSSAILFQPVLFIFNRNFMFFLLCVWLTNWCF
jgi:hypothetical protein